MSQKSERGSDFHTLLSYSTIYLGNHFVRNYSIHAICYEMLFQMLLGRELVIGVASFNVVFLWQRKN
ncbi:UNVERIFIED_CONTAM: hypothetical protein FKN15_009914 [Acipenser sinensis]